MEQLEKENLKEYIGAPKYKSDQLKELIELKRQLPKPKPKPKTPKKDLMTMISKSLTRRQTNYECKPAPK